MSFKRLDPEDFLVSIDSITATAWSTNTPTLTTFFTSSVTSTNDSYYKNVYQTGSTVSGSAVQFAIAYGNKLGSGSANFNDSVPGVSPTRTVYGQYRNLIYGDENAQFIFGTVTASDFWAISVDRARYKEHLLKGTFNLRLTGSSGTVGTLVLTDNSGMVSTDTYLDSEGYTKLFPVQTELPTLEQGTLLRLDRTDYSYQTLRLLSLTH